MNKEEYRAYRQEKIRETAQEISDLQRDAKQQRTQIDQAKEHAKQMLEAQFQEKHTKDAAEFEKQKALLQQLNDAAVSGDFAEMSRIKKLLEDLRV